MSRTLAPPARPLALIVDGDASLRAAIRNASDGHDLIDALRRVLLIRGYDVVLATSLREARRLMSRHTFERIYCDGTPLMPQGSPADEALSGPTVEDLGDSTVRIRIDQVLPWSVAMQLLDLLAETPPDAPNSLS
jgi:hypothetical protein